VSNEATAAAAAADPATATLDHNVGEVRRPELSDVASISTDT